MKIVLDVSAAFSIITDSLNSESFISYLERAEMVLAPDIYFSEVANTAWKYHTIKGATLDEAMHMAEYAMKFIDIFIPSEDLWKIALTLSCEHKHPAYDCFYLSIALKENASLLTNDRKLKELAKTLKVPCI
ncbi:MAG: type II toxin-antitoxin system VapC family toxin [Chitinophagales bacterium]|nr:type II toxin-antitoxin system VapC family toxin [Chitinophagales bacterium]